MKLFFLFILLTLNTYSQSFNVLNNNTQKGVPYANVIFYKDNKIIKADYLDDNGSYNTYDFVNFDLLEISCVGYESKKIFKEDISFNILLVPKIYSLDEITINKNQKTSILGFFNEKKKTMVGGEKGIEFALFINNNNNIESQIKSFFFRVKKRKWRHYSYPFTFL